jgi:hypothetical protein
MSVKQLYLLTLAATLGCGPASGTSATSSSVVPRQANLLTTAEIFGAYADATTAYDAIARLRPHWLSSHGPTSFMTAGTEYARVFLDGQQYGDLRSLRNIPASEVMEIRYYNSTEAGGRFGLRAGTSGVIEIRMNLNINRGDN